MNLGQIGRLAAGHLLDAIAGTPAGGGVTIVPASLVLRESTRRAAPQG
jgi:LacI family transcriptional regulator